MDDVGDNGPIPESGADRSDNASMDKNDTMDFLSLARNLRRRRETELSEAMPWLIQNQR
jgi:hypothetical protein